MARHPLSTLVSNCSKKELLHRNFSIFLTIYRSWNRTFIFVEHISMATSHFFICELQTEMELTLIPSFLPYLISYWLNYFIWATAQTIFSKFAGLKHYEYFSSSTFCYAMLFYPILYHTILYYTILGIKSYFRPIGSQCCKLKLKKFIKGPTTPCNQRIW